MTRPLKAEACGIGCLNRFRRRSREPGVESRGYPPNGTKVEPNVVSTASTTQQATDSTRSLPLNQTGVSPRRSTTSVGDEARARDDQQSSAATDARRVSGKQSLLVDNIQAVDPPDLWSAAFHEAIDSLGKDIDVAILKGHSIEQLLKELEDIDKDATQQSAFLRGVRYLRSIQIPLERFKLALDLASPLTAIEPTVATVFSVVRSVTAIAISLASADLEFAKKIGQMLEHISYIDDCDTLGQRINKDNIHNALVLVYQKILEFYKTAFEILTRKGTKLVMKMILTKNRLPEIIEGFLDHAAALQKLVQNATLDIVEDIKGMLYDQEISRWLGSEKMAHQIQFYTESRDLGADQACRFLLKDANFIRWYSTADSCQLAILGEMGCGKTVALAFLIDELRGRNHVQLPQPKVCFYFCRDDETGQAAQIFSTLVLAILEQLPGLKKRFYEWYKQNQADGVSHAAKDTNKLVEFLQMVLESLDRPLFIIIDGLDECDRRSQTSVIKSLKSLSKKTPRLKTIVSTRPNQEVLEQLDGTKSIELVSNAKRDGIIVAHAIEAQLSYLSEDVKALVKEKLSRLAQGSAIWTKMMVELIHVRKIRALHPMRQFLENVPLPNHLSRLYHNLLSRCTSDDWENQRLASMALKLLAIARRPFSIVELAWAAALGTARQEVTTVAALARMVDHERVLNLIYPFIARIDSSDAKKRQVRLVHQSVKEFINTDLALHQPRLRVPSIRTADVETMTDQPVDPLENLILDICVQYLLLKDISQITIFSEGQLAIEELPQDVDLFSDDNDPVQYDPHVTWDQWEESMIRYDPVERGFGEFFVYASSYWLEHYGTAVEALPNLASIEDLCHAHSTQLHNWTQQNCRPGCVLKPRFDFDSRLYDPLSITSLYGSEAMLRHMLKNCDFRSAKYLSMTALAATDQILQWGDLARLAILWSEEGVSCQLQNLEFFQLVIRKWSDLAARNRDWDQIFDLIDHASDAMIQERWANELFCMAAKAGCVPIIQRMLTSARHKDKLCYEILHGVRQQKQPPLPSRSIHQSVGEAVLENHIDVVEILLAQEGMEAHLQYVNSRGENVLHLAARRCNPAMFHLLVPRVRGLWNQPDCQGSSPLLQVIMSSAEHEDRLESARTILSQNEAISVTGSNDGQQDYLRAAVGLGDLDMCRLLVGVGKLNPLSAMIRDGDNRMILKDRTPENEVSRMAISRLLIQHL